jgi:hypothetical protein
LSVLVFSPCQDLNPPFILSSNQLSYPPQRAPMLANTFTHTLSGLSERMINHNLPISSKKLTNTKTSFVNWWWTETPSRIKLTIWNESKKQVIILNSFSQQICKSCNTTINCADKSRYWFYYFNLILWIDEFIKSWNIWKKKI